MAKALFDYQEWGAQWMAPRRRAGNFDQMRVGKTPQTIRALDLRGARRGWVVCPAVARENWCNEFANFQLIDRRIVKGTQIHDLIAWMRRKFDVLITSYELAARWTREIHDQCMVMDFVVYDEGHYLKTGNSQRSQTLLGPEASGKGGLSMWAHCGYWLTGTPLLKDPIDIWTFLRWVGETELDRDAFCARYFTSEARRYSAAQYPIEALLPELRAMIERSSISRTLAQVQPHLPKVFLTEYLIDGDTEEIKQLLLAHPGLDDAVRRALEDGVPLSKIHADAVPTLRRLIGEAKAVPYAGMIAGELKSGLDKIVIFGIHKEALKTIRDYLNKHDLRCVLINGEVGERERVAAIRDFQEDPNTRAIALNMRSGGQAISLTAGAALDVFESDWAPGMNAQALMRIQGITQTRTMRGRFITLARSIDVQVNRVLRDRTAAIAATDGRGMTAMAD